MDFLKQGRGSTTSCCVPIKPLALLGFITLSGFAYQAQAVTIATSATASGDITGVIDTDSKTNPPVALLSEALNMEGIIVSAYARAAMNESGVGAVAVNGIWGVNSNTRSFLNAMASWSDTYTNTTTTAQHISYDFSIDPAFLTIYDYAGMSEVDPQAPEASYSVKILFNGVAVFSSEATLRGGVDDHVLQQGGTDFGSTLTSIGSITGYTFDAYNGNLDLGVLAAGDSLTIGYEIGVDMGAPGFETGAAASIGDPNNLNTSNITGTFVAADQNGSAPVPDTLLLIGSFLGLIASRRRPLSG